MRADVVIAGAGLAGSAAAWALARRGRDVVLLDAFEPGHAKGSSHGSARIFRRAYPDPFYTRLTGLAGERWRQLEDEAGEQLVRTTGAVDFGPSPLVKQMYDILRAERVPAELLTPARAAERWPGLNFKDDDRQYPVLFHPEGGVIDADRAIKAMQRLAADRGANIRHHTPVTSIEAAVVHTADATYQADTVIVAAGAWLGALVKRLNIPLPQLVVTQVQAFHFATKAHLQGEQWPTFIRYGDTIMYGLPSGSDAPGAVKVGEHGQGTITTADDRDGIPSKVARERVREFVMNKVPGLEPAPTGELTCLYTSTENEDFIIDRRGPVVISSTCSGHGAKFAPLTGEILADLADGKPAPYPRFMLPELAGTFPAQSASLLAGVLSRP
jgi:sarcosine oxidase